jgi:hypothetical protein
MTCSERSYKQKPSDYKKLFSAFADDLIHGIFRPGPKACADELYSEAFGNVRTLEAFIEEVKQRT